MYDAVVVGAGPAGLSIASELAAQFKVLVVDGKKSLSDCTKSWFIPSFLVNGNPEVLPFMDPGIFRLLTWTFTDVRSCWKTGLPEGYYYVKEHEILRFWGDRVADRGSEVRLGVFYSDHEVLADRVVVDTTAGKVEAKLLIDASGHDSLIAKRYEKREDYYWWSVYGAIVEHPNGLHGMENGDYMLWQTFESTNASKETTLREGRPVFEYEVLTEQKSFPLILYLRKDKVDKEFMHQQFLEVLRSEEATKQYQDCVIQELKWGWYPSGSLDYRQSRDRVAFVGDAGCWTTPCGWGFGFIVYNYKDYAAALAALLKKDDLAARHLDGLVKFNLYERHQILLDAVASHFLANGSPAQLDRFIQYFNANDPVICEKIFTLSISMEELEETAKTFFKYFSPLELIGLMPPEDLGLLMRAAGLLVAEFIEDEVREFLGLKEPSGPGFDIGDNEEQVN